MDTETRNLRIVEPAAPALVTPADLRAQFDRDEAAIIRAAEEDVIADLGAMDVTLDRLPRDMQRRLLRARAMWRGMVLDGSPGAMAVGEDYRQILDGVDLYLAFDHQPEPQPAPRARKKRSDA